MSNQENQRLEDLQDETTYFRHSVTSYGADFDVEGLVRRIMRGDIFVPSFQRGFIWKLEQSSQFIESLLLGLPVPAIFLAQESETQKLLVIDGQQRLYSLFYFYQGTLPDGRTFSLKGVSPEFSGLTYQKLQPEDRRRLDNAIIHAIIVKQDVNDDSLSSIYFIFERLNVGGMKLQAQEIRSALYHGKFNDLLQELNNNKIWRELYGAPNDRMRDEELILRFFALYFEGGNYRKPMLEFLNTFMGANRNLDIYPKGELLDVFIKTIETILECIGKDAFKYKNSLNAALSESIMVGIARRLEQGDITDCSDLEEKYKELLDNDDFISSTRTSTTDAARVFTRINLATQAFSDVA